MNPTLAFEEGQAALVRRARGGDRAAFDGLARHHRAALLAVAFLRTSDLEAAEDLVQEVLTRAWQKLPDLQDPAAFVPWLRAILANSCRSWYRLARPQPVSLETEGDHQLLADHRPQPLEALLARERQRSLRKALVSLPAANRVALLMHVWGDYSYSEIAAFTGVPVTTVEGRIHRARQQLRRLLRDESLGLPGEARPERPRRKSMSPQKTPEMAQPLALVLFSHQFATLLDTGIALVRTLDILQDAPAPYGEAARTLRTRVERGEMLSHVMADMPELFSPFYRAMVRAGEVGAMLEETLRRAADLMTEEWKLVRGYPGKVAPVSFLNPGGAPLPNDWDAFSDYQRTTLLALFCETFGLLLVSGVPITQVMRTLAELLPSATKEKMLAAVERVIRGERLGRILEPVGILPRFGLEMIAIGEESGQLDRALERAAEIFKHDLECRLLAEA